MPAPHPNCLCIQKQRIYGFVYAKCIIDSEHVVGAKDFSIINPIWIKWSDLGARKNGRYLQINNVIARQLPQAQR